MSIRIKRKISTTVDYLVIVSLYNSLLIYCGLENLVNFQQNLSLIILMFIIQAILTYFNLSCQSLIFKQKLVDMNEEKVSFIKVILRTIGKPIIIFFYYLFSLRNWLSDNSIDENELSIVDKVFNTKWIDPK
jgi:hypothetical protein